MLPTQEQKRCQVRKESSQPLQETHYCSQVCKQRNLGFQIKVVHACIGQMTTLGIILLTPSTFFLLFALRQDLSLTWISIIRLVCWLASKFWGSFFMCPSLELQTHTHHTRLLTWVLETELMMCNFQGKYFTKLSPQPQIRAIKQLTQEMQTAPLKKGQSDENKNNKIFK